MKSFLPAKTTTFKISISLLASAAGLYFASRSVQWKDMGAMLLQAKAPPLLLGVLMAPIAFWLRGARWKILLDPFEKIPTLQLVRWQIGGLFINNILPLRMGELTRAYWTGHRTRIPKSTVLATIIMERLLDMASIAAIAALSFAALEAGGRVFSRGIVPLAAALVVFLAFTLKFALGETPGKKRLPPLKAFLPDKLYAGLEHFLSALQILKNKEELVKLILISPLIWSVDIAILGIFSRSLDLNLSWAHSAVVMMGTVLGVMVPAAPGAAGTYEAGGVAALTLLGNDKTRALSFILLLHGFNYLLTVLLGIPVLLAEGFSPAQALADADRR